MTARQARLPALAVLLLLATLFTPPAQAAAAPPAPACDPPAFAGVWRCLHTLPGDDENEVVISVVIVDLTNPAVHIGMALSGYMLGREFVECNSVNHAEADPTSNCPGHHYPFEPIPTMLNRYRRRGAVAAINTDYFGFPDRSHGAEGLAVQNGVRLDGPGHNGNSGIPFIRSYMAISPDNDVTFGKLIYGAGRFDLATEFYNTVSGGPILARRGRVLDDRTACLAEQLAPEVCTREYQSAAGLTADGEFLLLATGRHTSGAELARFLVQNYHADTVFKFDGGGSAQMAWLDAGGRVQGFDAEIEVNDGFRHVAEGLLVFSQPVAGQTALTAPEAIEYLTRRAALANAPHWPPGGCWPARCSE